MANEIEKKTMPAIEYGDDINTYAIRWHEWAKEALATIADLRKRLEEALGMEYRARQSGKEEGIREAAKIAWDSGIAARGSIVRSILTAIRKSAGGGK